MKVLDDLNRWYKAHCNGTWEHANGITIESLDNPGWWVKINLKGTRLEHKSIEPVMIGVNKEHHPEAPSWIDCHVKDGLFSGSGDPDRLGEIITTFLEWSATESNG